MGLGLPVLPFPNGKAAALSPEPAAFGVSNREKKGVTLDPAIQFFGSSTRNLTYFNGQASSEADSVNRDTAFAAAAYAYCAMVWRARMASQAALMVVEETEDGEQWIENHPLAEFLDMPSPDMDMGELLHLKSLYVDMTGSCLFVKNKNNGRQTGSLTPFSGNEFDVEAFEGRIFGRFKLRTATGEQTKKPEEVIFFREINPGSWTAGLSKVDVALSLLNLSQTVRATARALLNNAVFPSIIIQTDKDWTPDAEEWERYKASINAHAGMSRKGEPLTLTGGGTATTVSMSLSDLVPAEIMDRVEATVAAVFGIPAVILQFLVGLKNSPWSQMSEARRMAYEDTIEGIWQRDEKTLTRQLLRDTDKVPSHFIRFDRSRVTALKADLAKDALIVGVVGNDWSLNERRVFMGKPKVLLPNGQPDPRAEEIRALAPPPSFEAAPDEDDDEDIEEVAEIEEQEKQTKARRTLELALFEHHVSGLEALYTLAALAQLEQDRAGVLAIIARELGGKAKAEDAEKPDAATVARAKDAADAYLTTRSRAEWDLRMKALLQMGARRAVDLVHAKLGIDLQLLNDDVIEYANREAAWLIKGVSNTTKDAVRSAIADAFRAGEDHRGIAKRIQSLPAFDRARAVLVGRTESTRVSNGAPREALASYGKRAGRQFYKTWYAVDDERVRDEHAEMSGETVPIDEEFSNGLQSPGEPNCRCTLLYGTQEAA